MGFPLRSFRNLAFRISLPRSFARGLSDATPKCIELLAGDVRHVKLPTRHWSWVSAYFKLWTDIGVLSAVASGVRHVIIHKRIRDKRKIKNKMKNKDSAL